ncbi:MAG TPA: hypothetical protein VMC41_03085 [Candidatus Nanoarchaeia archaeon]|nr:hypothetical protein [Candidatus Nanoarchaeia archaeon]
MKIYDQIKNIEGWLTPGESALLYHLAENIFKSDKIKCAGFVDSISYGTKVKKNNFLIGSATAISSA